AREYLILAGEFPARPQSWASRLLPGLGIPGPPGDDQTIEPAPGLSVVVRSKVAAKRRDSAASRALLESIQLRMKSGETIPLADLENLQRALGTTW
ncbi:MAG: hypothetical protein LC772_01795, partial [Chloroflexi bacterium]|nr:hypothetical protein [Chloroflexota bacterium]